MKYIDEYRDPKKCDALVEEIHRVASQCWTIMEVCGGQTHGLLRFGIDQQVKDVVQLIHGPGCPVCVTPLESIDFAIELAKRPNVLLTSFGDMLRVPGSRESLLSVRAAGGNVRMVYSPVDAVQMAKENPQQHVVFFAVGFETTTPATAIAVQQASHLDLDNFSLLVSHVRVQPAMELLAQSPDCAVQGFLAAGHVCTVAGYESYEDFVQRYKLPVVVTGFEPVDLLTGILECVSQLENGEANVVNCYPRSVAAEGNQHALILVDGIYEVCDSSWRGMGVVPKGGLRLRKQYHQFDTSKRFNRSSLEIAEPPECRSGDVLTGRIKPTECECFAKSCTPETPLGAPMVSAEGSCAAYYRYHANRASQTA